MMCTCDTLPGRFVRIQLEQSNYLHFAELEVCGSPGERPGVGRVSTVVSGNNMTIAVVRPKPNMEDVEKAYKAAVKACTPPPPPPAPLPFSRACFRETGGGSRPDRRQLATPRGSEPPRLQCFLHR